MINARLEAKSGLVQFMPRSEIQNNTRSDINFKATSQTYQQQFLVKSNPIKPSKHGRKIIQKTVETPAENSQDRVTTYQSWNIQPKYCLRCYQYEDYSARASSIDFNK